MRTAAEPALPAVRSIAQIFWRVDIAAKALIFDRQVRENSLNSR
jgi:hypothetical protein